MDPILTRHHLAEIAQLPGPWVTICMPLRGGPLAKEDAIRYRNLVRAADELLRARATEVGRKDAILSPLRALADDHGFLQTDAKGLVVFASEERVEHWRVPVALEETAHVDARPYLEPLLPIVTDPTHFYIIAMSLHDVRLFECNRFVVRELPLPDRTPRRLEQAVGTQFEPEMPYRAIRPGAQVATYHAQGGGDDDAEVDYEKFVRAIEEGLRRTIVHRRSPVVLFASEKLEQAMRRCTPIELVAPAIHGNVELERAEELHRRAYPIVQPIFEEPIERAKERYCDLAGTGVATSQLEQVVIAAADGKIDTLFLREGAHMPGSFDPETHSVHVGNGRAAVSDLLDRAATDTFLTGGVVYRLARERMPVQNEVAAILRY